MVLSCWICGSERGGLRKGTMAICWHFCLGEGCPQPLALMSDNLVPYCMSLMFFKLMSSCWSSEGVSLSKSVHGPFKRYCLRCKKFLSSTTLIPTQFYRQKLWRLIFMALELWAWELSVVLGPFIPEISLQTFIHHTWVWDKSVLHLFLSYQCQCGFFFNSIVGFFFNSIVGGLPFSLPYDVTG